MDEQTFTSALSNLEALTWQRGDFHEAEGFYFSVFSQGKDAITREGTSVTMFLLIFMCMK